MKDTPTRQSHKKKNTFVFKGFSEKVRGLRVSARRYLLQRSQNSDGEDVSFFFETLSKYRDLNLTEDFVAFLRDIRTDVQTTTQLVHQEQHVVKCLSAHISKSESLALQPLFDLLVALANDIPKEFYKSHFYTFLPKLLAHLSTKDPELIESVFLCIVSLFLVLQKYLCEDMFELYHVRNFSALLSNTYPWYINELAAQSLGVLVRKIPKNDSFIGMALRKLKMDENQTEGVGRVFASMMKSDVIQRLHSCTPKVLGILLDLLGGKDDVPPEPALQAVMYAVSQVARYVTAPHQDKCIKWQTFWKEDATLVWPTLWSCVKNLLSQKGIDGASQHLNAVLEVAQVLISYKQGALILDFDVVVTNCLEILEIAWPDTVGSTVSDILVTLLAMPQDTVSHEVLQKTVASFLSSPYSHTVKFDFLKKVTEFQMFDFEILPLILPYLYHLIGNGSDKVKFYVVTEYIAFLCSQKSPLCNTGMDLNSWQPYVIDFSKLATRDAGKQVHICTYIETKVKEGLSKGVSNLEELSLCLLCLPHVLPVNNQSLAPYLTGILNDAVGLLKDEAEKIVVSDQHLKPKKKKKTEAKVPDIVIDLNVKSDVPLDTRKILFLIGLVVEVMAHLYSSKDFLASLSQLELLELLKRRYHYRENIYILRALDLHFTIAANANEKTIINEEFLKEIFSILAPALSSANPQVRLLVLHILSLFPLTMPPQPENTDAVDNLFEIMLKAECVPISSFEFKDRLRFITMVDAEHVKKYSPVCGSYSHAPLLLFMGQLYTNFRDMWNPLVNAISSYAQSMPGDLFWNIWQSKVAVASHVAHQVLNGKHVDPEEDLGLTCSVLKEINNELTTHPGYAKIPSKPDHLNYRDLLWRAMEKFPSVCEARNRDLVPLFFDFLEKEFFPVDFTVAPTQDIRAIEIMDQSTNEDSPLEKEANSSNNVTEEPEETASHPQRASVKSLCAQLALFSKFRNPKMLTQSKKLERMYLELLSHPSPSLQKLSFDCLMTYNHSFLTPYKDIFSNILENKSLTNTLTLFSIDGSEKVLEEKHRKDFMPYFMRILYGKMHFKTGSNTSGKSKINVRKAGVLRFLAGASEDEFETFLELAFDVLLSHIDGSALDVVRRSVENFDLERVVPLKRLKGALSTMENIIEKIANRMAAKKSFLLKVILYIANVASLVLDHRAKVKSTCISFLKHIRHQAQKLIVSFFTLLDDYRWEPEEINAVFEVVVWPNVKRLPDESLASPTPLLSLFECWANNPRYFPLLAKVHEQDPSLTPLPYIVKLVAKENCSISVTNTIFNMIEKLLSLADYDETLPVDDGKTIPAISCSPVVAVKKQIARDGVTQQNYGTALLVPHLEGLLQSMKLVVKRLGKGIKVSHRDLTILTSLTEWVASKEISEDLLELIIPLIINKHIKSEEVIAQLLATCSCLLPVVNNSKQFMRPLISLFGYLMKRSSRDALCQAVAAIASVYPEYKTVADLALDLNSWNPKMIEEVDYDRRLDGYKRMIDKCKAEDKICIDFCHFVVYNNVFVICHVDDSSLRDMSLLCLEELIDMCVRLQSKQPSEFKQIIMDRLLTQLKEGLKHEKEDVRDSIFSVLQKVVHKCHLYNEKLEDLYKLADETEDEGDFYSNMMHIQRHRRARALTRLADKLRHGDLVLMTETITDFLIPIVRVYLFKDDYAKDDHLMQASVRCVGAFAKILPWYPYLRMLKTYMKALAKEDIKHLRLIVKLIEAVINGFHEEVEEVRKNRAENGRAIKDASMVKEEVEESLLEDNKEEAMNIEEDVDGIDQGDMPVMADEAKLSKPQKVYLALVNSVIPQIQKILSAKTSGDKKHKVNKSKFPEDEDIKRIPLAFALVKLLKKLPPKVLEANVNSVLMKMITLLKCQSQSIRDEARAMLVKIMVELGGQYLPWLVRDLRSILTRGFQTHVLVFTLHSVLSQMRPVLESAHVDSCLIDMIEICKDDILGIQAEEKKVAKITTKVKEARLDKSYAILDFTAEFISASSLGEIILPLREVLALTQDKKVVNKMVRCLEEIASGLQRNQNISLMQKSVFIYGILGEKITLLTASGRKSSNEKKEERIQKPNSFLLDPEPKKSKQVPKTSIHATSHVFIEFALRFLCSLLRSEKFSAEDVEHQKLLDPYVGVLVKCVSSEYPEISVHALKCINLLVTHPLPSLKTHLQDICAEMFVILHKFSSPELTRGKLYELVQLTFRSLAFIIKTVTYYEISAEQVRVLLQYVQESLDDSSQQTTVFAVLQSIIARKIDAPELQKLIELVKRMSITCTRQYALNQARVTYYTYLLTYPMKRKAIVKEIQYYLGNLSFSIEEGRHSAITMIHSVIANFPAKLFTKELETNLWLKISEQLVGEQFRENRSLLHKSLRTLYERSVRKLYLIELCVKLLSEENEENCENAEDLNANAVAIQFGCKALSAFLDVSVKKQPKNLLTLLVPKIVTLTNPARYSSQMKGSSIQEELEDCVGNTDVQQVDKALVLLTEILTKLAALYITNPEWKECVNNDIWKNIQTLLLYPHIQVRLNACSLIGQLLAACPVEGPMIPDVCLTTEKARSLVLDLCEVLQTRASIDSGIKTQLALSVVRNLIYLVRNSLRVSLIKNKNGDENTQNEDDAEEEVECGTNKKAERDPLVLGSLWVIHRVGDMAYKELQECGNECTMVREAFLNLMAGVIVVVGEKLRSPSLFNYIIKHLARELTDKRNPQALATRTQEVAKLVKAEVGLENYTRHLTAAQAGLSKKRHERKTQEHQQKLVNPRLFNKKKKQKQLAGKISKKRKIAEKKGRVLKNKRAKLRGNVIVS